MNNINITEVNYDANRKAISYKPEDLFQNIRIGTKHLSGSKYHSSFQAFISLNQKIKLIDQKFSDFIETHKKMISEVEQGITVLSAPGQVNQLAGKPTIISLHKSIGEEIIFHMRIVLDTLIQLISIELNKSEFELTLKIKTDSIGKLLNKKNKGTPTYEVVFGNELELEKDSTNFLSTLNELFNSLKHSMFHTETNSLHNDEWPVITSLFAGYGDLNNGLRYHNHNGYHLMMGFQDCLKRILDNLIKYKASNNGYS